MTPQLLKPAVAAGLVELMAPIQAAYETDTEWQEIALKAYPPPVVHKKVKKPKDKGSRFPGAKPEAGEAAKPTDGAEPSAQ